jgi:hypothetical protein
MSTPETRHSDISEPVFSRAISTISRLATSLGAEPVDYRWEQTHFGIFDQDQFDPELIVGRAAILKGTKDGVSHQFDILLLNGAARSDNYDNNWVLEIHVAAAEGEDAKNTDTESGIQGLVVLNIDRAAFADLGHGTARSENPVTQHRYEEIVGALGLDQSIFDGNQMYDYDEASLSRLSDNLPDFS